jgi:hypothetical protein
LKLEPSKPRVERTFIEIGPSQKQVAIRAGGDGPADAPAPNSRADPSSVQRTAQAAQRRADVVSEWWLATSPKVTHPTLSRGKVAAVEETTSGGEEPRQHLGQPLDAMGQEKRRAVIGHSYAPSKATQLLYYGTAVAVIVALFIGGKIAADKLDQAPDTNPDQAPWSQSDAPQIPPQRFE